MDLYRTHFKPHPLFLTINQRAHSDPTFAEVLKFLQDGVVNDAVVSFVTRRAFQNLEEDEKDDFIKRGTLLCAIKKDYARWNHDRSLECEERIFVESVTEPPSSRSAPTTAARGLPPHLLLGINQKVMLTQNICVDLGLVNGAVGTVKGIIFINADDVFPQVLVKFDGYLGGAMPSLQNHADLFAMGSVQNKFKYKGVDSKRTMLPLVAASAMSIHKSQGQTLGKVVVNLGKNEFATGLTYTGITRVRTEADIAFHPVPTRERLLKAVKRTGFQELLKDNRTSYARFQAGPQED